MDISNFMTWFVSQVVNIFSKVFGILDSITFAGTSLLRVLITITILVPLVGVFLTLSKSVNVMGQRSERISEKREKANSKQADSNSSRWI